MAAVGCGDGSTADGGVVGPETRDLGARQHVVEPNRPHAGSRGSVEEPIRAPAPLGRPPLWTRPLDASEVRDKLELVHAVRSAVAGISLATRLLAGRGEAVGNVSRASLYAVREMEMARLERILARGGAGPPTLQPVDLDAVLHPLVVVGRACGHRVNWEPSGLSAQAQFHDVVEVVHALVDNVRRHAPGADIDLLVGPTAGAVELRVVDSGPGVSPQVLERLFTWGAGSDSLAELSIGLAVARGRAEAMNGALVHDSSHHPGAAFVLTLPPALPAPA